MKLIKYLKKVHFSWNNRKKLISIKMRINKLYNKLKLKIIANKI